MVPYPGPTETSSPPPVPRGRKAITLLSGGIDSATCLAMALDLGYTCHALSFDYGQRHRRELDCARALARYYHLPGHEVVPLGFGGLLVSALTDRDVPLPEERGPDMMRDIPSSYVPARNTIMLSIALAHAEVLDADAIFIGVNAVDYSGYPDCRPEYIQAFGHMAALATRRAVEGRPVTIETPLLHLTKGEIISRGISLGVPYHLTWSCYRGGNAACGTCDSCVLRLKGFREAGARDPIHYR